MEVIAIWLVFFSLIPIVYWGVKVLITRAINYFWPHNLVVELQKEDGSWVETTISPRSNKELFELTLNAVQAVQKLDSTKYRGKSFVE